MSEFEFPQRFPDLSESALLKKMLRREEISNTDLGVSLARLEGWVHDIKNKQDVQGEILFGDKNEGGLIKQVQSLKDGQTLIKAFAASVVFFAGIGAWIGDHLWRGTP